MSLEHSSHFSPSSQVEFPNIQKISYGYGNKISLSTDLSSELKIARLFPQFTFDLNVVSQPLTSKLELRYPCQDEDSIINKYANKYAPELFSKIKANLNELKQLTLHDLQCKPNLLEYVRMLNSADARIYMDLDSGSGCFRAKPLDLCECCCDNAKRNANFGNNIRIPIEDRLLHKITTVFGSVKSDQLKLMFLGSGGCLSEWNIVSQLMLLGFTNLDIHLVDIIYRKINEQYEALRFKEFFEGFPDVKASVKIYSSLEEFSKLEVECDVVSAIDFIGGIPKIMLNTSPKGFAFSSHVKPEWNWNREGKVQELHINPSKY